MADRINSNTQLSDLVQWYITDRQIELRFVPNIRHKGKIAPEVDFHYYLDARQITDRALAYLIMVDMLRRNYNFHYQRVVAALQEHSWRYYIASAPDIPWLTTDAMPVLKRPTGRPRKHAKPIVFDEALNIEQPEALK